jgi:uncharacterized membrane protein (DUF4010 family)
MHYNFNELLKSIPTSFINFLLVTIFSLIIGLSQRKLHQTTDEHRLFGTDRTFTFIGILGFLLLIADPLRFSLYIGGGIAVCVFLAIYYIYKIRLFSDFGITTVLVALLTYCIPLLLQTQPFWLFLLVIVTILIFTELKETFITVTEKLDRHEFVTFAKFIIMAGLILPILPDTQMVPYLSITPFKIWLGVLVISSISYISYLLRKFVFKESGIILAGILGGLYSSTATTVVFSKKLKEINEGRYQYIAAIILATAMMYFRVLILVLIFNKSLFVFTLPIFLILIFVTVACALIVLYLKRNEQVHDNVSIIKDQNPLEFRIAIIFTIIFILFTFLTQYAISHYGNYGLSVLSFIVGFADIDPFLLNIFQGKYEMTLHLIAIASFQAIISNNLAKMGYACFFAGKNNWKLIAALFSVVIFTNILLIILFS